MQIVDDPFGFLDERVSEVPHKCHFPHQRPLSAPAALHYYPSHTDSPLLILFISGNPGVLEYYTSFLLHLRTLVPHGILATSHIGHDATLSAPTTPLTLNEQLESKVELVEALLKRQNGRTSDEKPSLVLMGHSVGAWMFCEVMKRVEGAQAGILLFPSLGWIADTWNGRSVWVRDGVCHRPG